MGHGRLPLLLSSFFPPPPEIPLYIRHANRIPPAGEGSRPTPRCSFMAPTRVARQVVGSGRWRVAAAAGRMTTTTPTTPAAACPSAGTPLLLRASCRQWHREVGGGLPTNEEEEVMPIDMDLKIYVYCSLFPHPCSIAFYLVPSVPNTIHRWALTHVAG